jgi:hypothetical protein
MSEDENHFGSLRRLLALKRHEIPPPGYFNDFSGIVLQGIREGRYVADETILTRLFSHAPWMERIYQLFDAKPVFASGFVGALCLLLFFGAINAERPDLTAQPLFSASAANAESLAVVSPAALTSMTGQPGIVSSTNPVFSLQAVASGPAFGQQNPLARQVSFPLPGH